ncbi:hypothetical protein DEQ92_12155 [Haloferax sp. Atlit-6N]|nr:hypothetical protein DEQ92_12155 [Haloferax sp. Atlit-6N]
MCRRKHHRHADTATLGAGGGQGDSVSGTGLPLKWDNHEWLEPSHSHRPNEEHTNPQVASVGR